MNEDTSFQVECGTSVARARHAPRRGYFFASHIARSDRQTESWFRILHHDTYYMQCRDAWAPHTPVCLSVCD
jgi:hypothetical protein